MVRKENNLYVCEECGFAYKEKVWAGKCEAWCKEKHSCNIDITKYSVKGGD